MGSNWHERLVDGALAVSKADKPRPVTESGSSASSLSGAKRSAQRATQSANTLARSLSGKPPAKGTREHNELWRDLDMLEKATRDIEIALVRAVGKP